MPLIEVLKQLIHKKGVIDFVGIKGPNQIQAPRPPTTHDRV